MARQSLKNKWLKTAITLFGIFILRLVFEWIFTGVFKGLYRGFFALFEFYIGLFIILWWFRTVKYDEDKFDNSQEALRKFGSFMGVSVLSTIIICLGYLLFIIPGIILQFCYGLVFWIVADEPAMPVAEALKLSRKMMYGYKWKLFCLNCRFIGWYLLSIFTLGIGFLFVIPYQAMANIHFYRNVKAAYEAQNGEIAATEYQGMSVLNTVLLSVFIFVWNSGIVYLVSLMSAAAAQ